MTTEVHALLIIIIMIMFMRMKIAITIIIKVKQAMMLKAAIFAQIAAILYPFHFIA